MYVDDNALLKVFKASENDEYIQKLLREWNEEKEWGQKDMLMSKIISYVDDNIPDEQ